MSPVVWVFVGVVVVALVVGGYVMYQRAMKEVVETESQQIKSIAVLPFRDMSQNKDQAWFCEGLAESIINSLTHVEDLQVPALLSALIAKEKGYDIYEIGDKLKVQTVLEGSVVKSGNRLLITAQLINVDDGYHLWSQKYNREEEDVFPLIEEISLEVVNALKVTLNADEKTAIEKRYTENTEAYSLYMQGRFFWNKRTDEDALNNALRYFKQAIERDPGYALAYAGLADTYNILGFYDFMSPEDAFQKGKEAARKALEMDGSLAEAYASLGFAPLFYEWDWDEAESMLKQALELNPRYPTAQHWYAVYLRIIGKAKEAHAEIIKAKELDPLSPVILFEYIGILQQLGRNDEALELCQKALELDPDFGRFYATIGNIYIEKGNYQEAIAAFKKFIETSDNYWPEVYLGYAYALAGEKNKAELILNKLITWKSEGIHIQSIFIAVVYMGLGDFDKTFEWLERSYNEHNTNMTFIKFFYIFDPIRSDPRFKALLKKMNLPED